MGLCVCMHSVGYNFLWTWQVDIIIVKISIAVVIFDHVAREPCQKLLLKNKVFLLFFLFFFFYLFKSVEWLGYQQIQLLCYSF